MRSWMWFLVGFGLMAFELFFPTGFFLFILGLSGILVGLLVSVGFFGSWMIQSLVFCALAIALLIVLGERLRSAFGRKDSEPGQVVGRVVQVTADTQPGHIGSGELWGTTWRLENVDTVVLQVGDEGVVVSAEGITLRVKRK